MLPSLLPSFHLFFPSFLQSCQSCNSPVAPNKFLRPTTFRVRYLMKIADSLDFSGLAPLAMALLTVQIDVV
jgi:hypothetical protein